MTRSSSPIVPYQPAMWPVVDEFWRQLLGRNWNDRARERWEWLNARREHFLVLDGDRVLGNATLLRQTFVTPGGGELPVGWITDFYVSPELKGQGMGKRLARRLMEECPNLATFGQSQEARYCFSRLDWTGPDWVPLLAYMLPLRGARAGHGSSFRRVELDDPVLGEIWSARESHGLVQSDRSVQALENRLEGRPDAEYEVWIAAEGQRPIGWVILRFIREWRNRRFGSIPVGILVDMMGVQGASPYRILAQFAVARAARRGSLAVLAVESAGPAGEALRNVGYRSGAGIGPLRAKLLPLKGFMLSPGATSQLAFPPFLSFYDCDAELTF